MPGRCLAAVITRCDTPAMPVVLRHSYPLCGASAVPSESLEAERQTFFGLLFRQVAARARAAAAARVSIRVGVPDAVAAHLRFGV